MAFASPHAQLIHNTACETAALANCHCHCHGAGHQKDLILRAAGCASTADLSALAQNLETVLGGFHTNFRDVKTQTRSGRNVLNAKDAATIGHQVGRGATWFETVVVDEVMHSMFLQVANDSLATTAAQRSERELFVERITSGAISVVSSTVTVMSIAESHVWCSIVTEYISGMIPLAPGSKLPTLFDAICYPRLTAARRPASLPLVRAAGLAHLAGAARAFPALSPATQLELLRLVAAATCPDVWHHPAVARFCLQPVVAGGSWPPPHASKIVTPTEVGQLERRWARKRHW